MSKSIVKTLLEKGNEELNLGDSKGDLTPLMWACKLRRSQWGKKIHILSIFHKIHIIKNSFFAKFTFFNLNFHKIHIHFFYFR